MSDRDDLEITPTVAIPRAELTYRATRSGGPGGQHVNTSSTRIELVWDVAHSRAVTDDERARLMDRLGSRVDADGMVRVVASDSRSQLQNRQAAEARLVSLLKRALHVPKVRRATKPSRAAKEKRLSDKKRQADKKRERRVEE